MPTEIGIGALERGARGLAKDLEALGFETRIDVFRTGPGGAAHYGPSTVELEVSGTFVDERGDEHDLWTTVTFVAGGYGSLDERHIGGAAGWRAMKKEALARIERDFKRVGWRGY